MCLCVCVCYIYVCLMCKWESALKKRGWENGKRGGEIQRGGRKERSKLLDNEVEVERDVEGRVRNKTSKKSGNEKVRIRLNAKCHEDTRKIRAAWQIQDFGNISLVGLETQDFLYLFASWDLNNFNNSNNYNDKNHNVEDQNNSNNTKSKMLLITEWIHRQER